MKCKTCLIIVSLLILNLISVPSAKAGEITGVVEPPPDLGVVSVGSRVVFEFGADYSDAAQSMAIIMVSGSGMNLNLTGVTATMNGADISGQFDLSGGPDGLIFNCSSIQPANGTLRIEIETEAIAPGNMTVQWRYIYVAFQSPPDPPTTIDVSGETRVEVMFGVEIPMYTGWNLIGIPMNLRDPSLEEVFAENLTKVEYVYGFDNELKEYSYWISGLPPEYQTLKDLEPGKGYWVHALEDFNQTVLFEISVTEVIVVEKSPLDGKTVYIGDIVSETVNLDREVAFVEEIIEPDLNQYAQKLGYDVTFDILIDDAQAQAAVHLEKVQAFHAMGVDLIIGGRWSSQAQASLAYVNENDILLFSPSSTSPLLAIPDDNLYRMCPPDTFQAPAIAEMLWSWGIEAIIVIQRADAWADGIYNLLESEYPARGGVILERIRYATEVTEFSSYLASAESNATDAVGLYGSEHVGVLILSFSETVTMVTQATDYTTLYNLTWFGSDGNALMEQLCTDAPDQADHLKILSTHTAPDSPRWDEFSERYNESTGVYPGYYTGCTYDIAWAIAKAVLEAQSTNPVDVIPLLPTICNSMLGVTGWTSLNEDGDGDPRSYDIWGHGYIGSECVIIKYGFYDANTGMVTWFDMG